MENSFIQKLRRFLWASFLISLPITNFRYFPAFLSSSKVDVRPLLIYPLIPLLLIYTLPALWKRKLPRIWIPFLVFLFLVLISSSLPIIQGFSSELSETSVTSRIIRAGITLLLSAAIYVTVSLIPKSEEDLKFTLRWLYAGMAIVIIWGLLQTIFVLDIIPGWYKILGKIQRYITMNVGTPDRVMGLTLEPSWFADQLTSLWLPWVLPAALMNKTIYKRRWGWLTVEKIYLALLLFVLIFTLSRAGFMVALIVLGCGILFLRPKWEHAESYFEHFKWFGKLQKSFDRISPPVRFMIVSGGILVVLVIVLFIASLQSKYIFRMWDYWLQISYEARKVGNRSLGGYFRYIGFGPRFIYWETAYRIFASHPLFGVGLGNYTLHFQEMLPTVQVGYMPELLTRIIPGGARIATAKNFFARLLAETGIFGTAAFISFLFSLVGAGVYLWLSKFSEEKFWGTGALLAIIAFLVDSFSYDSLAIPNPWVVFGLITAALTVYTQKVKSVSENE
jgi:O-antigen ligase